MLRAAIALSFCTLYAAAQDPGQQTFVDAARIRRFHRSITQSPRLAGTSANLESADKVAAAFLEAGLAVETEDFAVWLSRPVAASLALLGAKRVVLPLVEQGFAWDKDSFNGKDVLPHLAYTTSGAVTAKVVYVNYGLPVDYSKLAELGVDLKGYVFLARYGKSFRGVKVKLAEEHGAAAILVYSDPADDGYAKGDVYPRGKMRPATGVQRGSALYIFEYPGDPLTPGEPAVEGTERLRRDAAKSLPAIPGLPISYQTARPILEALAGPAVPAGWQGGLPFAYHVGPGPARVDLAVNNEEALYTIRNVYGTLEGKSGEDGDFVLLGNHRDSWVNGAIDPGTGTACMLEVATVLGKGAEEHGWKRELTIRFASFDGEEYGIIGSVEYGELHAKMLAQKLVAYVNADSIVSGPSFGASSTPSLRAFAKNQAGITLHPDTNEPFAARWDGKVGQMGGGSDFMVFLDRIGVPCVGFSMGGPSGVYHSSFDTHWFVAERVDPGFRYHAALSALLVRALTELSQNNTRVYDPVEACRDLVARLEKIEGLPEATRTRLTKLATEVIALGEEIPAEQPDSALARADRAWIDAKGLAGRPWFRNLFVAPGRVTGYAAILLPGLTEAAEAKDAKRVEHEAARLAARLADLRSRLARLRSD